MALGTGVRVQSSPVRSHWTSIHHQICQSNSLHHRCNVIPNAATGCLWLQFPIPLTKTHISFRYIQSSALIKPAHLSCQETSPLSLQGKQTLKPESAWVLDSIGPLFGAQGGFSLATVRPDQPRFSKIHSTFSIRCQETLLLHCYYYFFLVHSGRIFDSLSAWHKFLNHPVIQVENSTTIQITGQENRYLNHHPDHPDHPDHPGQWGPVGEDGPIEWLHVTTLIMNAVEKLGPGPDQPLPVPRLCVLPNSVDQLNA